MLLISFITYFLSVVSYYDVLNSATIRDNKLITIYNSDFDFVIKVRVFELKEGTTIDIFNSGKTYYFGFPDPNFALVLLDVPEGLPEVKNRLWLKFKLVNYTPNPYGSPLMNWVGYINLDDMSFKNDSSFISFPTHENFPVKGYTTNSITNEFGSALYITGGEVYSKKNNSYSESNSFYKYNFTSKQWENMAYSSSAKLKPLSEHKSVVIDNRYLVILGGRRDIVYNSTYKSSNQRQSLYKYDLLHEYNSLYNLTILDTFTNVWESVNINANIFESNIPTFQFIDFMTTSYKDKIFVLNRLASDNRTNSFDVNGYFGILDLKSKSWAWFQIIPEDRIPLREFLIVQDQEVFNNQLIICTSFVGDYLPIRVYDLTSKRMKSKLRFSNSSNYSDSEDEKYTIYINSILIPDNVIVLIVASCTLFFGAIIYFLYNKIKKLASKNSKAKSNRPIREVWANSDTNNTNMFITFDRNNYTNVLYSNKTFQEPGNFNLSNTIEFDK